MIKTKIQTMLKSNSQRTGLIKKNILASFFIKGWLIVVQLLMVPLTLHCLGVYENGIWLTISSMLVWIDNMDVGLGNGLRNKLAEYVAKNDYENARRAVSSTLFMLVVFIVPVSIAINLWIWNADTYSFFNVDAHVVDNLNKILSCSAVFVCSTFIFKFIGNFYMGLQMPAINNLLGCLGQTLALVGTFVVYLTGTHSLFYIALANTIAPLVVYFVSYPITFRKRYPQLAPSLRYVDVKSALLLFRMGLKFFVLQISGVVLFMTTNILISKYYTPEMVTPYQIAYRYFSVVQLLFFIICVPYWSATTDAYNKKDFTWIKASGRSLDHIIIGIMLVAVLMIIVSKFVYRIWIGDASIVSIEMTIMVAVYVMILTLSMRYSYILNGFGTLKLQLITTVAAAVCYIPLAVFFCKDSNNVLYLLAVMSVVNLPGLIINAVQYRKIIKGTAKGIWLE